MASPRSVLARVSGPAAVLGGLLWIVNVVVHALKPEGCVAAECDVPGRTMREGGPLFDTLFLGAILLMGLGAAALVVRLQRAGRFARLGRLGLVGGSAGVAWLLAGGLVQALFFAGDSPYMPLFIIPGVLAMMVGVLLLGVAVLRAGVLPRWVGAFLILGTLAMLATNEQNNRVLLALPFGIAWMAAGYALWSSQGEQPTPLE